MNIITTLTKDEKKVLDSWLGINEVPNWLQHVLDNKIRQRVDASILELTDRNPEKLSKEEKMILLKTVKLPKREERDNKEIT